MTTDNAQPALKLLYRDCLELDERARAEVTITRSDGTQQRYAPIRYKQQIERAYEAGELVPAVARIVRRPTLGFHHLDEAGRPARQRMSDYAARREAQS